MFRKIKKIYFKIYHLFKLIGVFIVVFGLSNRVYAEECNNLIVNGQDWWKADTGNFIFNGEPNNNRYTTLEPLTQYTIFFDYGEENFEDIINTTTAVKNFQIWHKKGNGSEALVTIDMTKKSYTFTSQSNLGNNNLKYYFRMNGISGNTDTTPFINNKEHEFWLVKGTEVCRVKPEEPEQEDNVYSGFLTIYLDRITYLAEGFTNNPYLIAMVGIIFGFVVLDLLLKIINIRRRK